tara:strand:- start:253 stop:489 length:237 start_codon:yes stop_codon:yes gene_type:complete
MENKDRIKKLEEKITNMKLQLEVLVKWLKDYSESYDERDGALEQAVKNSRVETMFKLGDYLEEILAMDDEQIKDELND